MHNGVSKISGDHDSNASVAPKKRKLVVMFFSFLVKFISKFALSLYKVDF